MSDARFESMYALWTIMAFNLLLVGDFSKLNSLVMGTWTNDWAVAINQDALGLGAVRVDGVNASEPLLSHSDDLRAYAPMKVQECGGEPADPGHGRLEPLLPQLLLHPLPRRPGRGRAPPGAPPPPPPWGFRSTHIRRDFKIPPCPPIN